MIPTESRQSEGVLIFRILFQVRRIIQTAFVRLGDNNAKLNSLWVGLVVERSLKYASGKYDFVFRGRVVCIDSHWRHAPTSITHTHTSTYSLAQFITPCDCSTGSVVYKHSDKANLHQGSWSRATALSLWHRAALQNVPIVCSLHR